MHAYIHACMHAYIHTYMNTYICEKIYKSNQKYQIFFDLCNVASLY